MDVQIIKPIIYGIIAAIGYIVVPLIAFSLLAEYELLDLSADFKTTLIILGAISVGLTVVGHMFSKDTKLGNLFGIATAVYSGFYLFYIFGGFSTGRVWGNYQVKTSQFTAVLGLQLIAWIMLAGSIVSGLGSFVRLLENFGRDADKKVRGKFHLHQIFSVIGLLIVLFNAGYLGTLIHSGSQIGVDVEDDYGYSWDDNETLGDFEDDSLEVKVPFEVSNPGLYSISAVVISVDIYTIETEDPTQTTLPDDTKIGEVEDEDYKAFPAQTNTYDEEITVKMDPEYIPGLIQYDAELSLRIHFQCVYAGINIDFYTNTTSQWNALV